MEALFFEILAFLLLARESAKGERDIRGGERTRAAIGGRMGGGLH